MLKIFLSLYPLMGVLCGPNEETIELFHNRFLIYTDTLMRNLKITYKAENRATEEYLEMRDMIEHDTKKYVTNAFVYSVTLPNIKDGVLFIEIFDDCGKSVVKVESRIKKVVEFFTETYYLTQIKKASPYKDSDLFVYEANYTYINYLFMLDAVLVIGDSLDKKVQLDKSLELFNVRKISYHSDTMVQYLKETYNFLRFVQERPKLRNEHMNNAIYELVFRMTHFYSSIVPFGDLYNGLMYESSIISTPRRESLLSMFINKFHILKRKVYDVRKEFIDIIKTCIETCIETSIETSIETLDDTERMKFKNLLCNIDSALRNIDYTLRCHERNSKYDVIPLEKRNKKYLEEKKIKSEDNVSLQIIKLRKNVEVICNALFMKCYLEIFKFIGFFKENVNKNEVRDDFIAEHLKDIIEEFGTFYNLKSNLYGLFSDKPDVYLKQLLESTTFKELSPESILNILRDLREKIEECETNTGSAEILFRNTSKSLFDIIGKVEIFWNEVRDENLDVGLVSCELVEDNKESMRKDSEISQIKD